MALKLNNIKPNIKPKAKPLGFTIVELLVVIVIIGILAAIVVVSYIGISKKATESTLQSDLSNSKKQLALYYTEHGAYPTGLDSNKCPTGTTNPSPDTNYCLKSSSGNNIEISEADGSKYKLTATEGTLLFSIAEDSAPSASVLLPESDWITVGTQRWARKNLNVGTMILSSASPVQDANIEKYCYFNLESNCETYGALYGYAEATGYDSSERTRGICPAGSHIPSDSEWNTLEIYLGMTSEVANTVGFRGTDEGAKLKPGGSSGLNVQLSGIYYTGGTFEWFSQYVMLLSSSLYSAEPFVWIRQVGVFGDKIYRGEHDKLAYGFGVRCLGD